MSKHERIEEFVGGLGVERGGGLHPCYAGYFLCFNRGDYYEAHDVLEHLWLSTTGDDYVFYKGLIQLAGAFVHLKKHFGAPRHPTHSRRLYPAERLFLIAADNLAGFAPRRHDLLIEPVLELCRGHSRQIRGDGFTRNPWNPRRLPQLAPEGHQLAENAGK